MWKTEKQRAGQKKEQVNGPGRVINSQAYFRFRNEYINFTLQVSVVKSGTTIDSNVFHVFQMSKIALYFKTLCKKLHFI